MKIAMIFDMVYPYSIGGTEYRIFELAHRLARRHEVHLFGVKMWDGPDTIKSGNVTIHGVCRYRSVYGRDGKRRTWEPIKFALALWPRLRHESFDIVDCVSFVYFHCLPVSLYCAMTRTPLVMSWLQYWGDYWYEYLGWKGFFGKILESIAKGLSRHHLAISRTTKQDLVRAGTKPDNIVINYCGVDLKEVTEAEEAVAGMEKKWDIVVAARLNHQKNVPLLIEAVGILINDFPHMRLNIIGDGPDRKQLERLADERGLAGNIIFSGFIQDHAEVLKAMSLSRMFVLPSLLEGLGIVVIEAQACGLPVVVIRHKWNASQELISEEENGLIAENDPHDLADKIRRLLGDHNLRAAMSEKARATAKTFDWEKISDELENHYRRLTQKT